MNKDEVMNDEALLTAFSRGNSEAFGAIVDRYKTKLAGYVYNIVGNKEDTDDILQETFMRLIIMVKSGRYTESGRLNHLLFAMSRNLAFDYLKKGRGEAMTADDGNIDAVANSARYAELSTEAIIVANQTNIDLKHMIDRLPEPQRQVVEMRIYEEKTFKEISELTGTSINTTLGRMHYALINLRKMIAENNYDFEN